MAKFKVMMEPNLKSHEEPLNGKIQGYDGTGSKFKSHEEPLNGKIQGYDGTES